MKRFWITALGIGVFCVPRLTFATSLVNVMEQTIRTNPDILIAIHQNKQNEEKVKQTRGEFFPTIDVIGSTGPENSLNFSTGQQWSNLPRRETDLTITQNIFNGGRSIYGLK